MDFEVPNSCIGDMTSLREAIVVGDAAAAIAETRKLLDAGTEPARIVGEGISPAMAEVGRLFEESEYFVPELLIAARATKEVFQLLRPALAQTGTKPKGHVVLGTVQGDLHDIGKNLVAAMLEGGGFEVTDLGVDVAPQKFVAAVREKQAEIVGLSALLTTTLPAMKNTVDAFGSAGIREKIKVMVGGAPVTKSYAESIGADGYGENAATSVQLALRLIGT
jgi:5-methyltetrahydrofolate--homocysteine methyltransferase